MMEETFLCDRCSRILGLDGFRAVHKDGRELLLCAGHRKEHEPALTKQGWTVEPLTPPEPVSGPKRWVKCSNQACGDTAGVRLVKASPESAEVAVTYCKTCDTRTCGFIGCDSKAMTDRATHCPKGHVLMPRDTT